MNNGPVRIEYEERGTTAIVTPHGEIGFPEAPSLRTYLKGAQDKRMARLIVDLSNVHFMSTPGLAALVEALQSSKRHQTRLVLCGLQERVRAVFEIARLQQLFVIKPDAASAMEA
ncbi:MAG: STAS domain-containing protein [Phycisphaeraceae bacterium]|nr:MAG: STAS domain-containing protein [Phycisphaeraceae bacterium]